MADRANNTHLNSKQLLLAGGLAGTAVDTALYPLDTIKTRLQSRTGFYAAGGFRGIYSGLTAVIIGSAPSAAVFFFTYERFKKLLTERSSNAYPPPLIHMASASAGEIAACIIRVPTEVIKQRMQVYRLPSSLAAMYFTLEEQGILGLYRGYWSTVAREIPFTCLQFPLYEFLKHTVAHKSNRERVEPWEAAICGSVAGGTAAGITTPLDVVKTRLMLSTKHHVVHNYSGIVSTFRRIVEEEGIRALFSGIGPRVLWISVGGSIFLGVYEKASKTLDEYKILTS
ncbi:4086_t:CDS:2 [Paraglomus brasilianum]|uniref:4086_t:CDS:1 n=1 Tax=Paraglomus brasilianum TaxID=144538 RepID=A0A9N9BML0_9GLOM|nr:4086_t:CDS:2 [Paraglomus brasilianum]